MTGHADLTNKSWTLKHPTNGTTLEVSIADRPGTFEQTMTCIRTDLATYDLNAAPKEITTVTRCHRPPHTLNTIVFRTLAVAMNNGFQLAKDAVSQVRKGGS